jgi:hypothetical protein
MRSYDPFPGFGEEVEDDGSCAQASSSMESLTGRIWIVLHLLPGFETKPSGEDMNGSDGLGWTYIVDSRGKVSRVEAGRSV